MNYSQAEMQAIVLDSLEELPYKIKYEVTEGFRYSAPRQKYRDFLIKSLGESVYNKIRENFYSESYLKSVLQKLEQKGITCVTYFSEDYPPQLRHIPVPPLVLYCKGNIALLKDRLFAIVGSRHTLPAMLKKCGDIAKDLCAHFTVVTGTADGADSYAAEGALRCGRLIMVAAQGLDYVYPSSSSSLYKKAERDGLIISEQLPHIKAKSYLFPVRNRIIAALCEGVLVVSAGEKSGASITAEYAFEYLKDVFCFPYSIGVASGAGCNALIKKGAYLAENTLDIFKTFGLDFTERQKIELTERERDVLEVLKKYGEAHISKIAADIGCSPFEILAELSSLEVKGEVVRLGGNRYGIA